MKWDRITSHQSPYTKKGDTEQTNFAKVSDKIDTLQ